MILGTKGDHATRLLCTTSSCKTNSKHRGSTHSSNIWYKRIIDSIRNISRLFTLNNSRGDFTRQQGFNAIGRMIKPFWCDHNQMSQRWQRTQGLQSFLWSFSVSHRKDFWDEFFCNMLLKIHIMFSMRHIFCINFSWITNNFWKLYKFYQIQCFIFKNYFNFKLYENMPII